MSRDAYETPLASRYASKEMVFLFSPNKKFSTWRRLWVALAESEQELGLPVSDEQIAELKAHITDMSYEQARAFEQKLRHEVMAHVYAYGEQCPLARPIIHLGATSSYVGDNTDIILMRDGLRLIRVKLLNLIDVLQRFATRYRDLPTLAFTHFQAAQPTTVGKRATLWIHDLLMDYEQLEFQVSQMKLLGCKGTSGTEASFLELFDGDHDRCKALERKICNKMGFEHSYPVSGQTYSRKLDSHVLNVLSGIAQSASKFSGDLRLLQHLKQIEEPFETGQVGSSAMPYKQNPMRCERIASLSRYVLVDALNPAITAATQWFERTLDDSANRRLCIPEGFLCVDAILALYINVASGLVVYEKVIKQHFIREIAFMATENILMDSVKRGGDRQDLHEKLREYSNIAGQRVKHDGLENNLCELIAADPAFGVTLEDLKALLEPKNFVGRAPQQVDEFLQEAILPLIEQNRSLLGMQVELTL
jgi:adenylosuccinate lyase